jgi:LysR family transcriptional activator of nhaA
MDWLNYHHLYYFWILHQEGTFTKAAARLRVSQSTVSEQIAQLEQSLGQQLIDRSHRKQFKYTETGLVVIDYAQSIFEKGQEMMRWLKTPDHKTTRHVRIGVQSGLSRGLQIEFLRPILNKHDHKIEIVTGDQERLLRLLNEYKIDLILMSSALDERFTFQSYAHLLFSSSVIVVAGPRVKSKSRSLNEMLKTVPIYLPAATLEIRIQIDAYFERHKLKPNIVGEIDDIALLRLLALSTDCMVAIPQTGIEDDMIHKSVRLVHRFSDIKKNYYAITRQQKFPNPVSALLIKTMKKES